MATNKLQRITGPVAAGLLGVALLMVTGCGSASPTTSPPPVSTSTAGPASTTSQPAAGSVVHANATVEVGGLLVVGADTAKVGDTIRISVTNSTSDSIDAKLLDPSGNTAGSVRVASHETADLSAVASAPGSWKVTFEGTAIGSDFESVITVR
jgi:hypothetical protein